jgi:GNAT superfamily N-acetyltransferase
VEGKDGALLRPALPEDVAVVARIWFDGWRDAHLREVPEEVVAARGTDSFRERTENAIHRIVVAELQTGIAAFTMVDDDKLEQIYVAAPLRGTGLAARMLSDAERRIAAAGHAIAWLAVGPGNVRARRFYESRGWLDHGAIYHRIATATGPVDLEVRRYLKHL